MLNPMHEKIKARTGGRRDGNCCDHDLSTTSLKVKPPAILGWKVPATERIEKQKKDTDNIYTTLLCCGQSRY